MIFTLKEQQAFRPPTKLKPSEWAEQFRYLDSKTSAEPGKYRNSRTPYMAGIIDCILEDGIEEIVLCKSVQIGFTTGLQNLIGWIIDNEPSPTLIVYPDEQEGRKVFSESLIPLIDSTPALKSHVIPLRDSVTKNCINFDSMSLYLGWSGSPQSLARRAVRFVFLDEVDKYSSFAGKDADPISLAKARAKTYLHRKRIIIGSTPTVRTGNIWKSFEDCPTKRYFHVPCPHCNHYQRLVWDNVKWPEAFGESISRNKRAEEIELKRLAYYQCSKCDGKIEDKHKQLMLQEGKWISDNDIPSARIGFHISALYSPWISFSSMAAQFQRSIGDMGKMMEFKNQWLAEPFEEILTITTPSQLHSYVNKDLPMGICPKFTGALVLSADTQKDYFYWVLNAYGAEFRNQIVDYGVTAKFEDLQSILDTPYKIIDSKETIYPSILMIDSGGDRTGEIYSYALSDPSRVYPIKGASNRQKSYIQLSKIDNQNGLILRLLDTEFFKDELERLRLNGRTSFPAVSEEFLNQLCNEIKVFDRKANRPIWKPKSSGAANHYLDCCVYNLAGAYELNVGQLQTEEELEEQRLIKLKAEEERKKKKPQTQWLKPTGFNTSKKWI